MSKLKHAPYSTSRLLTYNQCPKKFDYKYIQKIKTEFKPSIALTKGNIVHSFLENHELNTQEKLQALKKDKQIVESPFYTKELIKECFSIYTKFIDTKIGKENFDRTTLGNEMRIALDNKLQPCEYFSTNVMFRGYMDRISVDEYIDLVYVTDYKSGSDKSEGPYKQKFDQLIFYASWYFAKFPVNTIKIQYSFVEHDEKELTHILTRENLKKYQRMLVKNIHNIETAVIFPKEKSPLCDYCDYVDMCMKSEMEIDKDEIPF